MFAITICLSEFNLIACLLILCQEWQQECRELLDLEEKDRAEERHMAAIQRHRQELEDRQQEERKHIMARYWKALQRHMIFYVLLNMIYPVFCSCLIHDIFTSSDISVSIIYNLEINIYVHIQLFWNALM